MKIKYFQNRENYYFLNNEGKVQYYHPFTYAINHNKKEFIKRKKYYEQKLDFMQKYGIMSFDIEKRFTFINDNDIENAFINSPGIVFETTSDCNLKCVYCGYGKLYNNNRKVKYANFELTKIFLNYFINLRAERYINKKLFITFYGGEPLLNYDYIINVVNYIKKTFIDLDIVYSITTNGMLIRKYFDFLLENNFIIYVSLDGDCNNNEYRATKENGSSYLIVYNNLKWMQNKFPDFFNDNIYILSVLHNKNTSLYKLQTFINNEFGKYTSANILSSNNVNEEYKDEFQEMFHIPAYNKDEMRELLLKNRQEYNRHVDITKEYKNILLKKKMERRSLNYNITGTCIPFSRKIFISAEGKIYPCERINQKYIHGSINPEGIDIDFISIMNNLNHLILGQKFNCVKCENKFFCNNCIFQIDNCECIDYNKNLESTIEKKLDLL